MSEWMAYFLTGCIIGWLLTLIRRNMEKTTNDVLVQKVLDAIEQVQFDERGELAERIDIPLGTMNTDSGDVELYLTAHKKRGRG